MYSSKFVFEHLIALKVLVGRSGVGWRGEIIHRPVSYGLSTSHLALAKNLLAVVI